MINEQKLRDAQDILPQETIEVLRLYYIESKSFKEIADKLNKSLSTIYNHHSRGIYLLKNKKVRSKVSSCQTS